MTTTTMRQAPSGTQGALLLADISGYTSFLQAVAAAHGEEMATMPELPAAYPLITSLLDGIVGGLVPPFRFSKLEGDAVFAYGPHDALDVRGEALMACLKDCYADFQTRRNEAANLMFCDCSACGILHELELKFVLHWGSYALQSIAGQNELLGPDVTMAHLLMKNSVAASVGRSAYALVTEAAAEQLGISLDDATTHTEHYNHYQPIDTRLFRL